MNSSSPRVIVVGGGLSGLSAAHTLYERGANVLLLDKNGFMGGNSTKATSGINGAGTSVQQDLDIKDSAKIFFEDTKKSARDLARDDLIKVLTGRSADAISWLMDRFKLDLSQVSRLGGHSQPRTHRGGAQFPGMVITYAQMEALEDLAESQPERIKIIKKAKATGVRRSPEGRVIGVEYEHEGKQHFEEGPVVLATGGYAADFDKAGLLYKYRPEYAHLPTTNGDHSTGDGHKMILNIGGKGIDLEKVQVHPTGLVDPKDPDAKVKFLAAEALRGVGGLLLDGNGDRFCDELGHRDYVTGRIWENNKYPVRLILNADSIKEIEWHVKHYCGRGLMKTFNNGHEVAKEIGISSEKLAKTFADYQKVASGKEKDHWGKKYYHNSNFNMDCKYAVAIMTPVLHYTMGGVEIDPTCRVLDTAGKPIDGLFACGELAGGVHGANRLGGSSLLGCVVFGRVAGDAASSFLLKNATSARLNQIANHLETKIRIDPESSKAFLEFSWAGQGQPGQQIQSQTQQQQTSTAAAAATSQPKQQSAPIEKKEYSLQDVQKHNTKDDCWVVVNGEVLDVTKFLPDHPGGEKAILLYAGRDATEEFNMLHDPKVVKKYAPESIIGTLKK